MRSLAVIIVYTVEGLLLEEFAVHACISWKKFLIIWGVNGVCLSVRVFVSVWMRICVCMCGCLHVGACVHAS